MKILKYYVPIIIVSGLLASCNVGYNPNNNLQSQSITNNQIVESNLYLLAVQWIPEWCAIPQSAIAASATVNNTACSDHSLNPYMYHGIWPDFSNGGYPSSCYSAPTIDETELTFVNPYTNYLESPNDFINHEWSKHGTCSNFYNPNIPNSTPAYYKNFNDYFIAGLNLFHQLKLPQLSGVMTINDIKTALVSNNANLKISASSIIIWCALGADNKYHFSSLNFCVNYKTLKFENCPDQLIQKGGCTESQVTVDSL